MVSLRGTGTLLTYPPIHSVDSTKISIASGLKHHLPKTVGRAISLLRILFTFPSDFGELSLLDTHKVSLSFTQKRKNVRKVQNQKDKRK